MGGIISSIFSGGIGQLTSGIAQVINSIKGKNPEDAAKLQELLSKHEDLVIQVNADLEKAKRDENVRLNDTAGANIRAETQSSDKFTSRARPSVIYGGLVILGWNYIVIPIAGIWAKVSPVDFPAAFWEVWGIVVTGYVFARTAQELGKTTLGGAGGSIKLPFGVNVDSKGD